MFGTTYKSRKGWVKRETKSERTAVYIMYSLRNASQLFGEADERPHSSRLQCRQERVLLAPDYESRQFMHQFIQSHTSVVSQQEEQI